MSTLPPSSTGEKLEEELFQLTSTCATCICSGAKRLGISIFQIKVSVMETEWFRNMDPGTGILVSISRTFSGIVPFWKLEIVPECVLETVKILEHVMMDNSKNSTSHFETGKILEHVPETRIIPEHFPKNWKNSRTCSGNWKIPEQTHSRNRKNIQEHVLETGKFPSRNRTKNLITILNVIRDWMWM